MGSLYQVLSHPLSASESMGLSIATILGSATVIRPLGYHLQLTPQQHSGPTSLLPIIWSLWLGLSVTLGANTMLILL